MHFLFHCLDKPNSLDIRKANRDKHLAYLSEIEDRVLAAGPLLAEDGESMIGSVLIVEFPDRAEAEEFARNDPYAQAGLFASVTIWPWRRVFPRGA